MCGSLKDIYQVPTEHLAQKKKLIWARKYQFICMYMLHDKSFNKKIKTKETK